MKRKNIDIVSLNTFEEESSSDDQEATDEDYELEDRVVESDEADVILNASATDSDEEESDVDTDLEDNSEVLGPQKSKNEKVKEEILQRYQERQGKQLYIRFPHKVPETQESLEEKVRELTPLIVKVHKPRQRHVRFCLVDFATKQDRDVAFNKLKKSIKKGDLKKYVVNIPRTESSDFVKELAERKVQTMENKKAKQRLKKSLKENNFTSTVVVLNLPKSASTLQIRELFADAVDINLKAGKGKLNKDNSRAAITFASTIDARNAVKKKVSLGGNQLIIKFDNKKLKQKHIIENNDLKNNIKNNIITNEESESLRNLKLESTIHATKEKTSKKRHVLKHNTNKSKKVNKNAVNNKSKVVKK